MKTDLSFIRLPNRERLSTLVAAIVVTSFTLQPLVVGASASSENSGTATELNITKDAQSTGSSSDVTITSMQPIPREPALPSIPAMEAREVGWLGVATVEAPEVLTAQLNLSPGVGLVVTFVAENSPAAKAGLERNDLLVAFDDQELVLPAQLRKLVQSREEASGVSLTYYRNGQKQRAEVVLGKTRLGPWGDAEVWKEQLRGLEKQWRDVDLGNAFREPLQEMEKSLKDLKVNQQEIQEQIRRAYEQAREAANNPEVREQLRRAMEEARRAMKEAQGAMSAITVPAKTGVSDRFMNRPPRVVVRSSGDSAKSLVQTDQTGTYVLVRNPVLRLTVHDAEGELVFDGEIETDEQRGGVPPEVWEHVEPLLEKFDTELPAVVPTPLPAPPPLQPVRPDSSRGTI